MPVVTIATFEQRPDLASRGIPSSEIWPEYNLHGDVLDVLWPRLEADLPHTQLVFYEPETDELVAEAHAVPCWWDGTIGGLSEGIDATMVDAFERFDANRRTNALCALAAEVRPTNRGRGLARTILLALRALAGHYDLEYLLAPVRPSWKERYPITPIERYVTWRNDDGEPFDPWMRVHHRLGARLGPALPHSLRITAPVGRWEKWTSMVFPETGRYVFPRGLAPLDVDRDRDLGTYWEPNVWMMHDLR